MSIALGRPETADELHAYYDFRWRMLRRPWGQPRGSEIDRFDDSAYHVFARDGPMIIGVGRIHRVDEVSMQIRYMAVAPSRRGQGIGTRILQALEQHAADLDSQRLILHAREKAVPFYSRVGYTHAGPSHILFGSIRHFLLHKFR